MQYEPAKPHYGETQHAAAWKRAPPDTDTSYAQDIIATVLAGYHGPVAVRMADGPVIKGHPSPSCFVTFNSPGALRDLVLRRDLIRLGEAYLSGAVDIDGDLETLFDLAPYLKALDLPRYSKLAVLAKALRIPPEKKNRLMRFTYAQRAAKRNSKASISHHYDVGNDFYQLWLDPEMVYSCAYFRDAGQPLAEAQRDKLDYICRKLRLAPGQRLLDIGCGWGALILWAARHYGVQAHGITLSEQQYQYAVERVHSEGLDKQIKVEPRDYRDLPRDAQYDRVVSVGMFEHIGVDNFSRYFGTVKRVLKTDGLFLNHGISYDGGWQPTPLTRFINKYVFPDGELARISDVNDAMDEAGFELLDVESLRRHYALTLRHWIGALESKRNVVIGLSNEKTYRLWRLYMAGSAYYFNEGSLNVYQVLTGHAHQFLCTPMRRDDLYRN